MKWISLLIFLAVVTLFVLLIALGVNSDKVYNGYPVVIITNESTFLCMEIDLMSNVATDCISPRSGKRYDLIGLSADATYLIKAK